MDHDVLERGRVRREAQAQGDVGCRTLNVTLGKRKSNLKEVIILKYLNQVTMRWS